MGPPFTWSYSSCLDNGFLRIPADLLLFRGRIAGYDRTGALPDPQFEPETSLARRIAAKQPVKVRLTHQLSHERLACSRLSKRILVQSGDSG